jgi:hypothetical protein
MGRRILGVKYGCGTEFALNIDWDGFYDSAQALQKNSYKGYANG